MLNNERKTFYQIITVLSGLFMVANLLGNESYSVGSSLCGLIFGFSLGKLDTIYDGSR